MLTGDLVTMSRAADRAKPSAYPNVWRVRNLTVAAVPLSAFKLLYCLCVLAAGWFILRLSAAELRTFTFLMLVLAGQANVYVLREHGHFWQSRPALVMLSASAADVAIVSYLATRGILMTALPPAVVSGLFATTLGYALGLDLVKMSVLARVRID
jgi:H+-transporting ATPase